MWPFPKKHFEWREPKDFRRATDAVEAQQSKWWHKPVMGAVIACMLMVGWCLGKMDPTKQPPPFALTASLALPAGLFYVYFMSWLVRLAPKTVVVFEDHLLRSNGLTHREWKYRDVSSFALHNCGIIQVLVLQGRDGKDSLVGVSPGVDLPALADFLGKRIESSRIEPAATVDGRGVTVSGVHRSPDPRRW